MAPMHPLAFFGILAIVIARIAIPPEEPVHHPSHIVIVSPAQLEQEAAAGGTMVLARHDMVGH